MSLILCVLCVAWPVGIAAEPTKKLGDVCPRLHIPGTENKPGAADEPIIIDNRMVRLLAEKGRFAAIAAPAAVEESVETSADTLNKAKKPSKTRDRWRSEHRREVAAIRKLALRLAVAREDLRGLQDQYYGAHSEAQRIRIEPRLNRKKLEIKDLEYSLQKQRASFSRLIREARQDGAQPGWFRDLPRP